jgi:hypothetical protein
MNIYDKMVTVIKVAPYNFWNMTKSWFRFNFLKRGFLLEDKYWTIYIEQSSKSWKLFTKKKVNTVAMVTMTFQYGRHFTF